MILGWDIMVDNNCNAWLIECNKGPDLSASTPVTKELRECMLLDLAKMFDDYSFKELNHNDELDWIGGF